MISKRKQTNTLELMAFFWHGNSASVRLQNPPKASKTLQKPSKHLERDPTPDVTLVCDSHDDRFLQTAQISLKRCRFPYISLKRLQLLMISLKYTSASRKRVTHTVQLKLRDKGSIVSTSIFRAQKFPQVQLSSEQVVINLP